MPHFEKYPKQYPIVVHAESRSMAAAILFAAIYERPIHIAHVSLKEEILLIKAAKEKGIKVTCEVTPHHLFLPSPNPPPNSANLGEGKRGAGVVLKSALALQQKKMLKPFGKTWILLIASPPITLRIHWKKKIPRILRQDFQD